jgi:transposase-like protein
MCYIQGMSINLVKLADEIRSEGDAYRYLEGLRWGDTPVCSHCGSVRKHYFLTPANGKARQTRTGSASERRVWKCADCRKQFTVLTGTIFHRTKIPVRTWLFVIFEMCASKNGVAAREIERKYGLTAKSAWFMCHRIREAMKREPMTGLLSGRVVADETFIGGKAKNMHKSARKRKGLPEGGAGGKAAVLTLVSRETGEVRSQAIPNVSGDTLRQAIFENVDRVWTHLHTDSAGAYEWLTYEHSKVDHSAGEYVRGDVSTNQAENYFSQLKRSIDGTHHHVSREHLDRYLAEFDFRFSTCKDSDAERMGALVSRVAGRRLTYRQPAAA